MSKLDATAGPRFRVRRVVFLVVVGLLAVGAFLVYRWSEQAADLRDASALVQSDRFADAIAILDRALDRDPNDPDALRLMVIARTKSGALLTDVAPFLDRWCRREPRNAEALKLRLGLRWQLNRTDAALEDGLRLLELTPGDDEVREEVAELLLINGRFDEAERECRRSLEAKPEGRPRLLTLLAKIHKTRNQPERAAAVLDEVLRERPDYTPAVVLRGVLHADAGEFDRAVKVLRPVLDQEQKYRQAVLYPLSLALARTGQVEEGRKLLAEMQHHQDAERLLKDVGQQPNNLDVKVRAAEALLRAGRRPEAKAQLDEVLKRDPNHDAARRLLATMTP